MRDRGRIILGLILFLIIITFPAWYNVVSGRTGYRPAPEILTKNDPERSQCVMPVEYMRAKHPELLNEWRDSVVRRGERIHTSPDGRRYNMSLSNTCMNCHRNKAQFCDQCHDYLSVKPFCWDCHVEPPEEPK